LRLKTVKTLRKNVRVISYSFRVNNFKYKIIDLSCIRSDPFKVRHPLFQKTLMFLKHNFKSLKNNISWKIIIIFYYFLALLFLRSFTFWTTTTYIFNFIFRSRILLRGFPSIKYTIIILLYLRIIRIYSFDERSNRLTFCGYAWPLIKKWKYLYS